MDYNQIFNKIRKELEKLPHKGKVADYIPELAKIDPDKLGVHLTTIDDQHYCFGDADEKFSIQSIAKVLSLAMAYKQEDEKLWKRVGVEPSGTPFNSLLQLEHDNGKPRNPMINSGALVVCDVLVSYLKNPKEEFLEFVRKVSGIPDLQYSEKIASSERSMSYINTALINLMKYFGNIHNDIEVVMDFYVNLCSIEMTCKELAHTFLFLANDGVNPYSKERIITASKTKRINAIMQLCGFYDQAGDFSFKIGLPGKSGVGGGIVAVHPGKYSIVVWSPRLNKQGNSSKGMEFLEMFTTETKYSIF
ncbi:glutaminase [Marivirga sp. S37H4]|uniref:Glutaminase n=1 Tax=Marivirga aurantiaca TaxID=2802615 RepID=A0A934WWC5_9BACT|nr:glutaminase [Marivirga aurantiaca]MBK6264284.1 glutaminase [Marivirga aurantiaca]